MKVQVVGCKERKGTTKDGKQYHFFAVSVVATGADGVVAVGEITRDSAVQPGHYVAELEPVARDGRLGFVVSELKPAPALSAAKVG